MGAKHIPNAHHIARHAGFRSIYTLDNGQRRVLAKIFLPRSKDPDGSGPEKYLSVDWLEYFNGNLRQRLDQIRCVLINKRGRNVGSQSFFAIVNVGNIKEIGQNYNKNLLVKTTGDPQDPSHSGVCGLTPEDTIIAQEIASSALVEDAWVNLNSI